MTVSLLSPHPDDDSGHRSESASVLRDLNIDQVIDGLSARQGSPDLARWFPSAGGTFDPATDGPAAGRDLLAAVEAHSGELADGLRQGVQTNEVGRCAPLAVGFTAVLRRFGLPLRLLELGASAGLNLRWDRWRYESGETAWGDPEAPLRFVSEPPRDAPRSPDRSGAAGSAPLGPPGS